MWLNLYGRIFFVQKYQICTALVFSLIFSLKKMSKLHFQGTLVNVLVWLIDQGKISVLNVLDIFVDDYDKDGEVIICCCI